MRQQGRNRPLSSPTLPPVAWKPLAPNRTNDAGSVSGSSGSPVQSSHMLYGDESVQSWCDNSGNGAHRGRRIGKQRLVSSGGRAGDRGDDERRYNSRGATYGGDLAEDGPGGGQNSATDEGEESRTVGTSDHDDGRARMPPPIVRRAMETVRIYEQRHKGEIASDLHCVKVDLYQEIARQNRQKMRVEAKAKIRGENEKKDVLRKRAVERCGNIEEFVRRSCAWGVLIALWQSRQHIIAAGARKAAVLNESKQSWAAVKLTFLLPKVVRRFKLRRNIRLLLLATILVRWLHRHQWARKQRCADRAHHLLKILHKDVTFRLHLFMRKVKKATRIAKAWVNADRAMLAVLRRQWRIMEAMTLMTTPALALTETDMESLVSVLGLQPDFEGNYRLEPNFRNRADYTLLHSRIVQRKQGSMHLMARDEDGMYDPLPKALRQFRVQPAARDELLQEVLLRRKRTMRQLVHQVSALAKAERKAQRAQYKSIHQHLRDALVAQVHRRFPLVVDGTPLFEALVDLQKRVSPEIVALHTASIRNEFVEKVPPARKPYAPVLVDPTVLYNLVERGLRNSKIGRMLPEELGIKQTMSVRTLKRSKSQRRTSVTAKVLSRRSSGVNFGRTESGRSGMGSRRGSVVRRKSTVAIPGLESGRK